MTAQADELRDRLRKASAARKRADAALERARQELIPLIYEADGVIKQTEVVEITGYNREHVRRIVREEERRRSGKTVLWAGDTKGIRMTPPEDRSPDSH